MITLIAVGCKRDFELSSWEVDLLAPIARGELELSDISSNERIEVQPSGLLHLKSVDTLIQIGLDSLIGIPDTTFTDEFIFPIGGFQLPPGFVIYDSTTITRYKLKQVELTNAVVRNSLFTVKLTNSTKVQVIAQYRIPSATNASGDTFVLERAIPAKSSITEDFNLDGYTLDMRGRKGNQVNTIVSEVKATTDPNGPSYNVGAGEGFSIENTFKEIIPEYATGYFGNEEFTYQDSTNVELYETLDFESLDITSFDVDMIIDNGIGADLRLNINSLGSFNIGNGESAFLDHPIIGQTQEFTRAIDLYNPNDQVKHIIRTISFDEANSNLDELFELNPSALIYDLALETNPLGNISLGNDFVYYGHSLTATMLIDVPLRFGVEGLSLDDTFDLDVDIQDDEQLGDGELRLFVENGFPFQAELQLFLEDELDQKIDSLFIVPEVVNAASVDASGRVDASASSVLTVSVNKTKLENLKLADHIRLSARLDSYQSGIVEVYDDYALSFKLVADVSVTTE